MNSCKGFFVFVYAKNATVSLHTMHAQHSLLNFGFFIYHVFMRINKFAVQCWLICLSFRAYCFSDVADIKTSWLWDGQDFWILEVNVNIFLSMALTQNSYFVSFETIKVYNWIVKFFFFFIRFQPLLENCVMGMP